MGFMKKLEKKAKNNNPVPSLPSIPPPRPLPIIHIVLDTPKLPVKPYIPPPPPPKEIIRSIDKAVIKPIDIAVITPTETFVKNDIIEPTKDFTENAIDGIKDVIKGISDTDFSFGLSKTNGSKGKGHKNKSNDEGGEFNPMWYYIGGAVAVGGYFMM